ncbi:MAG: hypothetical protein K0S55_116 [Clostridia bacterium]|nr:hypothetical protein [Clostridia bacterium]
MLSTAALINMNSEKLKIYLIGNAHLDPVWLWRYQEGFAEIKATFQSALDRIEQFDDFVFTSACAAYYEWVSDNAPEMFEKIKIYVKNGKWQIVGGWWIQPDCNIPSGESFCRHSLISQRFFINNFGKISKVGYNVDSFGHNANLPQILKKSGMDYYVYMRPSSNGEKKYPFPNQLFWWQSKDGSNVLTYRISDSLAYCSPGGKNECNKAKTIAKEQNTDQMLFYGVGNHGGGPTVGVINGLKRIINSDDEADYLFSGPQEYFENALKKYVNTPLLKGDLQHHASGCYSANSEIKMTNRIVENRLTTAEKCSVLANKQTALPYDKKSFNTAWKNVLFNQFHDIMGGCSIRKAYDDARDMHGEALSISSKCLNAALQRISWNINTAKTVKYLSKEMDWTLWEQGDLGTPVVVYNPLSWEVTVPCYISNREYISGFEDQNGLAIPFQRVRGGQTNGNNLYSMLFMAKIPAMGYATYWAYLNKVTEVKLEGMLKISESELENDYLKITFDKTQGFIKSIYDKKNNFEYIKNYGAKALVIENKDADTWAHNIFKFRNQIGEFNSPKFEIIENGDIRCTLRVITYYNKSELFQDFTLYRDSKDIEVDVKLFFHEELKMIKIGFDTLINKGKSIYEIPYGFIEKEANGEEEAAQNWVTVENDNFGFSVINKGKYSFDINDGEIRLTAARSSIWADHYGNRDNQCEYQDQGENKFSYIISPYKGTFRENDIVRKGWQLNTEFASITETYHQGELEQSLQGVEIDSKAVILAAMKQAEEDDSIIIRLYETYGENAHTNIKLKWLNVDFETDFRPSEIKTFKINSDKSILECNIYEEVIF